MKDEKDKRSYTVGYGKPAREHQWKPGQSGNPRGRPKGSKSRRTVVREEMEREVTIVENGKSKEITVLRAIVKKAINMFLKDGDLKPLRELGAFQDMDDEQEREGYTFTLKLEDQEDPDQDSVH